MQHIIFDCDGVIIDSEILYARIAVRNLAGLGIHFDPVTYCARFAGMMDRDIFELISKEYQVDFSEEFHQKLQSEVRHAFEYELPPIPGMGKLISSIPNPVSIVSNSHFAHVRRGLQLADIQHIPDERIFTSEMVPNPKPAPDVYLHALNTNDLRTEDCIVVEDSEAGVSAAKAAGLAVIGFLGGGHITKGHDKKLMGLGVDYLAENALELENILKSVLR